MATVALIGVKGNLGYKIFPELVASDYVQKIHVLSRKKRDSGGGKVVDFQVDYHDPDSLEKALKGVDAIINTMGTEGDFQVAKKNLVDAAAKAGVRIYFPSEWGIDPQVDTWAVRHKIWDGKKADDAYAIQKGLKVIPVYVGLHLEHPVGGFQKPHGFYPEEETWYMPGTGDVPVTYTGKRDIALSVIELIKMAMKDPDSVPPHVRIGGSNLSPKQIVEIFNKAAKGKTHIKLKLLNEEESKALFSRLVFEPPKGEEHSFDQEFMNEVATRVFTMSGGGGNLDFSQDNHNELVNPGETKWKWKTMEEYAEETDGMPIEMEYMR